MQIETAVSFLKQGIPDTSTPQAWADLGCGNGMFTEALSMLLPAQSTIHAVDRERISLPKELLNGPCIVQVHHTDFTRGLQLPPLDGIVMANALHYVKEQTLFLKRVNDWLADQGRLLIVEYDTDRGNPWVPHPIPVEKMKTLAASAGFGNFQTVHRAPSAFGRAELYSIVVTKQQPL